MEREKEKEIEKSRNITSNKQLKTRLNYYFNSRRYIQEIKNIV